MMIHVDPTFPTCTGYKRQFVGGLLLVALGVSAYASLCLPPYSRFRPKRIALSHIHDTRPCDPADTDQPGCLLAGPGADGAGAGDDGSELQRWPRMRVHGTRMSAATIDSTPLSFILDNLAPVHHHAGGTVSSQAGGKAANHVDAAGAALGGAAGHVGPSMHQVVASNGREFTPIFPVSYLLSGRAFHAPQVGAYAVRPSACVHACCVPELHRTMEGG